MNNPNKKRYYTAKRRGVVYALHCSVHEAQCLGYMLEDVQPCSKAEYQAAREAGACCYADALEIIKYR